MPIIMKSIFEPGEYEKIPDDDIGYIVSLIEDGDYMVELSQDKKISLKSLTMKIRAEKDPKKRNDLKLKLPCFNMGMFEGKCKNDNFKYSYYLIYDIDNIPTDKIMDDVKKILKKYVTFYYTSPSGNGIKFAIRVNDCKEITKGKFKAHEPITETTKFRETYRKHLDFFSHEIGVDFNAIKQYYKFGGKEAGEDKPMEIDNKCEDPRRSPFICYDPDIFFNPDAKEFVTFEPFILTESTVRSYLARPDSSEVAAICDFFCRLTEPLTYDEWIHLGMALANEPDGFLYWNLIPPSESYRAMSEDKKRAKFKTFKNTNVTMGTFYYLAIKHGYTLMHKGEEHEYYPFLDKIGNDSAKNGKYPALRDVGFSFFQEGDDRYYWLVQTGKNKVDTAFQWGCFLPEGISETKDGRELKIFSMDGEYIALPNEIFVNANKFREYIHRTAKKSQYLIQNSDIAYNRLFEYVKKAQAKKIFYVLRDIGHIADDVWNLGNICMIKGQVVPADDMININDNVYMLQMTDNLKVSVDKERMMSAFKVLEKYYGKDLPMIMGWATAHMFYREMIAKNIYFPLLFLHGSSGSGKSTLAEVIMMLHGIDRARKDQFSISMESKTSSAARDRLRTPLNSLPFFIDEYKNQFWGEFKAMYDRNAAHKSTYRTQFDTYSLKINSGTIVGSVLPPISGETDELVNRCLYIEMTKDSHKFNQYGKGFSDDMWDIERFLSSWIIEVRLNYRWDEFFKNYLEAKQNSFLSKVNEKESRIENNFRLVMAGWEFAKEYFPDYVISENYWHTKYIDLIKWTKGRGYGAKFIRILCRMYHHFLNNQGQVKLSERKPKFTYEGDEYVWLEFNMTSALWGNMIEIDNRAEKLLSGLSMQQIEQELLLSMPKEFRHKTDRSDKWLIAVKSSEIEATREAYEHAETEDGRRTQRW